MMGRPLNEIIPEYFYNAVVHSDPEHFDVRSLNEEDISIMNAYLTGVCLGMCTYTKETPIYSTGIKMFPLILTEFRTLISTAKYDTN